jgi:DNA-binding transcriptional ArsR family regulator
MEVGSPFGSPTRTRVLLALERRGESYPRELARLLLAPLSVVQKAVRSLERDALVTARMIGRTRLLQLNPGYLALAQLRSFLAELSRSEGGLSARVPGGQHRPRRKGRSSEGRVATGARAVRPRTKAATAGGGDRWRVW